MDECVVCKDLLGPEDTVLCPACVFAFDFLELEDMCDD